MAPTPSAAVAPPSAAAPAAAAAAAAASDPPTQHVTLPPELPLLSRRGEQPIVHFAKLYQRVPDGDAFESLADLADELADAARHRRRADSNTDVDTATAAAASVAVDQMQLLRSSRETVSSESAPDHFPLAPKSGDAKGKPMVRFATLSSATSPFVNALLAEQTTRARHALEHDARDELYSKVQQLPWENNILWGIDFAATSAQAASSSEQIVEMEDIGYTTSSSSVSVVAGLNASSESRSSSAALSAQRPQRPRLAARESSSSSMVGASLPPLVTHSSDDFDMTKPRTYRWEIENEPRHRRSSKHKPATVSSGPSTTMSTSTATTTALPCPLNRELLSGSWVDAIGWSATQDMPKSRLVLDDNDALLLFSTPKMEDSRPTLRIPERKIGAAEQRLKQLEEDRLSKASRIKDAMGGIDVGEGTATGPIGTEVGKKPKDTRVVKNIGVVHHSLPAIKLSLTKPELPKSRLRELHRPRGKFKINERLRFVAARPNVVLTQKDESAMLTQIKKSSDLNPTAGGKLILIEYSEQNPPMLASPGMAARILHYWRPPAHDDDLASLGSKKKATKRAPPRAPDMQMGQVITLGNRDESPFVGDIPPGRVVTSLNSKLYKVPLFQHKATAPFAATPEQRAAGDYELFLLCRSVSKGKKGSGALGSLATTTTVHVMELPDLFIAGQVEPQMEVPAPNSRGANEFIRQYMSFHILRLFKKASDGERLKIEDIARAFPNQSATAIRKRMKEVATFERGGNDSGWWKKKPASQLTSEEEIRTRISPESVCLYESMMAGQRRLLDIGLTDIGLTKLFTPSEVNGAIKRLLKRLELRKQQLSAKLIEPLSLERRAKEKANDELWKADPLIRKLERDIQVARYIDEQLQLTPWNLTNNYVECHLQGKGSGMLKLGGIGDPTGRGEGFSFVRVPQSRAKKKDGEDDAGGTGGAGGGTGGAGGAGGGTAKAGAVQKAVAAVTGTAADLRKLKMKEAGDVLRNLGLAEADIKKLRRWDRVHMIRELSNRATAHGFKVLSKFARDERRSLSAQQQEYRKKCDVIYARQMDVLSARRTTFSSDEESDGDEDLDEWEKDIEAGITGGNDMEKISKGGPKNLFAKGGGGLNRSAESLREREDAVELRRLMEEMKEDSGTTASSTTTTTGGSAAVVRRPDVDASKLRNQLRASGIKEGSMSSGSTSRAGGFAGTSRGGSIISSAIATPTDHMSRPSSPSHARRSEPPSASKTPLTAAPGRKVIKRTTRVIEEDGTESVRIEFIVDERHVARFRAMQQRKERQLKSEERALQRKRKRVLALEDDPANQSLLDKAKKRKQLQEELKQLQITAQHNRGYQEMLQSQGEDGVLGGTPQKGQVRCTQCGQAGHIRTNRSCPLYMVDDGRAAAASGSISGASGASSSAKKSGDSGGSAAAGGASAAAADAPMPLKLKVKPVKLLAGDDDDEGLSGAESAASGPGATTLNLSELRDGARKHLAEKKRKRMQEIKEQAELYKRPYVTNAVTQSRSRMPVERLASSLESVVSKLLDAPESELFRAPVDASIVTDYYRVVKQPMDLGTIQRKVTGHEYATLREFVKDVELLVSNSKLYNGDPATSVITANAAKVLKLAQDELAILSADN